MPPDTPTHSREGLIQVIAVRLDNLHADVYGMRDVLKELATAVTKLAVIEERQGQAAHAGPSEHRKEPRMGKARTLAGTVSNGWSLEGGSPCWITSRPTGVHHG